MRWGFLGASRIGDRSLAPAVREAGHTLQAVAARDPDRAAAFALSHGAIRAHANYDAVLADPAVDAVYIALTNDAHLPWTLAALAAGKHVLCEKPLALDATEVARMQAAEQASGRRVMEAFGYRFNPVTERIAAIAAAGTLGRLAVATTWFAATMPATDFRWTASLGGGALLDIGTYCVNLLRLVAAQEPARVSAAARMRGGVDAGFSGALHFPDGLVGQFTCSFAAARSQGLALIGADDALIVEAPFSARDTAVIRRGGAVETIQPDDPYRRMVTHFAAAIADGTPFRVTLAASLAQARVLDALVRAARDAGDAAVAG